MSQTRFAKPPLTLAEQVALLESRGLVVADTELAQATLLRINYYRFGLYAHACRVPEGDANAGQFFAGTTFDQVARLYTFDSELRALLSGCLEPIEIAFRAAVCHESSTRTQDPHWYLDPTLYADGFDYQRARAEWEREYRQSRESFALDYGTAYTEPPLPPSWIMCEILSMGRWSTIYYHLADKETKTAVARHFGVNAYYLASWIHVLTVLRNLCAHHSRIWNRHFEIRPKLPAEM